MSDVRDALINVLRIERNSAWVATNAVLADAILERFDVVEKPVVTDEALGVMTRNAYRDETWLVSESGRQLRLELEAAGLRIVKVEQP